MKEKLQRYYWYQYEIANKVMACTQFAILPENWKWESQKSGGMDAHEKVAGCVVCCGAIMYDDIGNKKNIQPSDNGANGVCNRKWNFFLLWNPVFLALNNHSSMHFHFNRLSFQVCTRLISNAIFNIGEPKRAREKGYGTVYRNLFLNVSNKEKIAYANCCYLTCL